MLLFVVVFGIFTFFFSLYFFVAYFRRSLHTFIKFPFANLSQLWCLKFVLAVCFMSSKQKEKGQSLSPSAICITDYSLTTHSAHKAAFVFDLIALIVAMTAIF